MRVIDISQFSTPRQETFVPATHKCLLNQESSVEDSLQSVECSERRGSVRNHDTYIHLDNSGYSYAARAGRRLVILAGSGERNRHLPGEAGTAGAMQEPNRLNPARAIAGTSATGTTRTRTLSSRDYSQRLRCVARKEWDDLPLRSAAADFGAAVLDRHVEFAANPELSLQVNSRFDGKTGALDQLAMVARFKRVEIGPGAVHFAADRMAGAMDEDVAVAGLLDNRAGGAVSLFAAHRLPFTDA